MKIVLFFLGFVILWHRNKHGKSTDSKLLQEEWLLFGDKNCRKRGNSNKINKCLGNFNHRHRGLNLGMDRRNQRSAVVVTQWILILAGDISLNPGPVKFPCKVCRKAVKNTEKGILCDACEKWLHTECINIYEETYVRLGEEETTWKCPKCQRKTRLNDSQISTESEVGENCYNKLTQELSMNGLKVGHLNVNGLLNKLHEIKIMLQETKFDVLGITETHLHKDIKDEQIHIDGYKIARKDRDSKTNNWGGSLIFYRENVKGFERFKIEFRIRSHLD